MVTQTSSVEEFRCDICLESFIHPPLYPPPPSVEDQLVAVHNNIFLEEIQKRIF